MSKKVRFVGLLLLVAYVITALATLSACSPKEGWSQLLFATKEDKSKGYIGGTACQHLTYLARSPQNKNILYFGTDAAGICRSTNGGKTWEPCNKGLFTSGVSVIEIDPKNDKHIVVVNATSSETTSYYAALFYTEDGGDTWVKSEGTRTIGFSSSHYYYDSLQFDESSYDEKLGYCTDIYFATPCERDFFDSKIKNDPEYRNKRGLYKSTDGGKSFEKLQGTEELTDGIISITDGKVTVANMYGIFALNGNSYTKKSNLPVHSLQLVGDTHYVLAEDGIYTTKDFQTYNKIESDNLDKCFYPRNLTVCQSNPNHMILFAEKHKDNKYSHRPYYSLDGGKTWTLAEGFDGKTDGLFYYYTFHAGVTSFDPDDENVVISIIGGEVIKSTDGGKTWMYWGDGVHNLSVGGQFHFNIYDENIVYMGGYDFGGALTTDGGKTWQNVSLSKDWDGKDIMGGYAADKDTIFGVYVDTWSPGSYFRDYRYVCYSHDGGQTVNIDPSKIKEDPQKYYAELNIDHSLATAHESSYQSPNNKNILFCANYRSTDNGYHWVNMLNSAQPGEKCLQVYTHSGKTLYGCSKQSGFVLKSDDDGKTWQKVNTEELKKWRNSAPSHVVDIAVDETNGFIYAVYGGKLFRMKMDGSEITDLTTTMAKDNFGTYCIRTVTIDPRYPNVVYCGGSGDFYMSTDGVRRSTDCGETWETIINNGSSQSVVNDGPTLGFEARCLRVRSDGTVWCSCLCLGVCKYVPPKYE